jgi:hypothetical protein
VQNKVRHPLSFLPTSISILLFYWKRLKKALRGDIAITTSSNRKNEMIVAEKTMLR